jgi:ABC-type maltose transport system permease subunit
LHLQHYAQSSECCNGPPGPGRFWQQAQEELYPALLLIPLAKPMLAIVAIQSFVIAYNEYAIASTIMTQGLDTLPLAVGLQSMIFGQYSTNWSLYSAGAVLGSLPMIIIFYSLQKYFIGGLTDGGVKA